MEFTINEPLSIEDVLAPAVGEQAVDSLAALLNSLNIESAKKAAPKKSKSEDEEDEDDDFEDEEDDIFEDEDFGDEDISDIDPDFEEFDLPKSKGGKSAGKSSSLEDEFGDDFGDLNIFDDEDGFDDDF